MRQRRGKEDKICIVQQGCVVSMSRMIGAEGARGDCDGIKEWIMDRRTRGGVRPLTLCCPATDSVVVVERGK